MPSYFVRQPNGLFARYSEVVDHFTHLNLTRVEAVEVARQKRGGGADPEAAILRAERDEALSRYVNWAATADDGLRRWRYCIQMVAELQGPLAVEKVMTAMDGDPALV